MKKLLRRDPISGILASQYHDSCALMWGMRFENKMQNKKNSYHIVGKIGRVFIWRFGGMGKNRQIDFRQY